MVKKLLVQEYVDLSGFENGFLLNFITLQNVILVIEMKEIDYLSIQRY